MPGFFLPPRPALTGQWIGRCRPHAWVWSIGLALILGGSHLALAQSSHDVASQGSSKLLAQKRWEAPIHGLSLRPPKGVKKIEQTTDGSLVTFVSPSNFELSVSIHYTKGQVNLKRVSDAALKQFSFAYPSRAEIADPPIKESRRRRTAWLFLAAEDNQGGQFIWGQFYLVMHPHKLAALQIRCDPDRLEHVGKVLSAVIDSIKIEDTKKLQQRRRDELKAGQKWLDSISTKQIKQRLDGPDQLFRIVENKKDVGYLRLHTVVDDKQLVGENLGPGLAIKTQSRLIANQKVYDSQSSFYESDDGQTEIWSERTTLRRKASLSGAKTSTWTETGVRSNDRITVSRNEPARLGASNSKTARTTQNKNHWPVPSIAYLSQADLYAMRAFYPDLGDQTVSFYAYDSKSQSLTLRTVTAKPLEGGGYKVIVRPTPSSAKRTYIYDVQGKLVQRRMADGRIFIRTTPDKLRRIWKRKR